MRKTNTLLHINQPNLRHNVKTGEDLPVVTARTRSKILGYAHEAVWDGPSKLVYAGEQLSCGARIWIETEAPVELIRRPVQVKVVA